MFVLGCSVPGLLGAQPENDMSVNERSLAPGMVSYFRCFTESFTEVLHCCSQGLIEFNYVNGDP